MDMEQTLESLREEIRVLATELGRLPPSVLRERLDKIKKQKLLAHILQPLFTYFEMRIA